ncbi:MAG: propanediol utilization protein [Anaerolineae bacterium]|nr:propanediol utilization protein [Anaerolineae bacterium]
MDARLRDIRTQSGRSLGELTLEAVIGQELTEADFRISGETLSHQADAAAAAGYAQVAANLRRAAELTQISNEDVLAIYSMLRPGRASYSELQDLGRRLELELHAPFTARLVYEAAEAYRARNLVTSEEEEALERASG